MSIINKRAVKGYRVSDPANISNMTFSEKSGARKSTEVGRKLIPLKLNATTWTTDASTALQLPSMGRNFAIYNNSAAVHAVTLSPLQASALAAGAVDSSGNVGIACKAADYTYVAAGEAKWIITDSALLLVYMIDDDTEIKQEASR